MAHEPPIDFNDPIWAILRSLPSMLSYWDLDLICRFANRAHEDWFGVKASKVYDTAMVDLLGAGLFAAIEPYVRAALRGEPQEFDQASATGASVPRRVQANLLPHIVNGKVLGLVVHVTDVTRLYGMQVDLQQQVAETQKALGLLSKSEAALRQAERLGQLGSWSLDVASGATTWSPQLFVIFGIDPADEVPNVREHAMFFTPESWARLKPALQLARTLGQGYALELEYVRRDGHQGWVEARAVAERDARGVVVRLHGTAQEVTERHRAHSVAARARRIAELEAALSVAEGRIDDLARVPGGVQSQR